MDGHDVSNAFPAIDEYGQRYISLSFNSRGASRFGQVTRENVGRQLAIILDGTLYSAPVIRDAIEGGHAQITGSFSNEESQQISTALISGNLPVNIIVQAVFDIDPTLGKEEVQIGIKSGIAATIATILFMTI
jgi:preprotein translocase subunit SecD